jgi:hypothetical protein
MRVSCAVHMRTKHSYPLLIVLPWYPIKAYTHVVGITCAACTALLLLLLLLPLLLQEEARTQLLWDDIKAAYFDDGELNKLMHNVLFDNSQLFEGLESQHKQALQLLHAQLAPAAAAASRCAGAGRDEVAREAAIVARLPVCGALPPQRLAAAAAAGGAGEEALSQ